LLNNASAEDTNLLAGCPCCVPPKPKLSPSALLLLMKEHHRSPVRGFLKRRISDFGKLFSATVPKKQKEILYVHPPHAAVAWYHKYIYRPRGAASAASSSLCVSWKYLISKLSGTSVGFWLPQQETTHTRGFVLEKPDGVHH